MCLTSEIQTPISPLFMNENIKCGYSFSKLERKKQCGSKIISVVHFLYFYFIYFIFFIFFIYFFFFLHFHRLPCELENARVLYKIKRKFAFFFSVNTKYISFRELKT